LDRFSFSHCGVTSGSAGAANAGIETMETMATAAASKARREYEAANRNMTNSCRRFLGKQPDSPARKPGS
jgi:hypothetical protein